MRIPRIYTPQYLNKDATLELDESAANHVGRVLRMTEGRELFLFNGEAQCHFKAVITEVSKKRVSVNIIEKILTHSESPLGIHLGQALAKGDKMEFTIQKSVELGVKEITPLWTDHCDVKLNKERLDKKLKQWQGIIISACEQSGRDLLPILHPVQKFEDWIQNIEADEKWVLDPRGNTEESTPTEIANAVIAVGPEGGLSQTEIDMACQAGFKSKLIGPRILRTETAALTAISLLQFQWGDF